MKGFGPGGGAETMIRLKRCAVGPISPNMRTKVRAGRGEIASYIGPRAFAPGARPALEGLGYAVVPALSRGRFDDPSWRPAVRLVDERQYDRIPDAQADPDTPIVLVTGSRAPTIEDGRIAGHTGRPIEVDRLYPILQRALERNPRSAPRVETHIAARGMREDRRWVGNLTSLSIGGCYLRTPEQPAVGTEMSVQFAVPRNGIVTARAVCVHARGDGVGLAFTESSAEARREIARFVSQRLATI